MDVGGADVITPLMFQFRLIERARSDRRHDRAARGRRRAHPARGRQPAAARASPTSPCSARRPSIRAKASALGRGHRCGARASRRTTRNWSSGSPREYARLRAHKGMTVEQAREHRHRRLVLRHHDGAPRAGRRHGLRRGAHHRAHHPPVVRDHQDGARDGHRVQRVPDVPGRPGAGLRRLRGHPGPDRRAAGRHRHLLGGHRRPVRHRPAGRDAVLLHRRVRHRRRRRQGPRGNRARARAAARSAGRGADPVRRRGRPGGRRDQAAGLRGRRPGHRADLPGPEHRQQHLQGGAAHRRRGGDRPGAAGPEQAGQRPVPRCAGRGHREHRRDHRDPGPGSAGAGAGS